MAKKRKHLLNPKEREIIRILHNFGGAMTANEISRETGISYVTVKKHLKRLLKKGLLSMTKKSSKRKIVRKPRGPSIK